MDEKTTRPMTPFDELTIPEEVQMLKLLLPYTPASGQKNIGILIRFLELQHTIQFFRHSTMGTDVTSSGHSSASFLEILEAISPYLAPKDAEMIRTFREFMNIMEMAQTLQSGFSDQEECTDDGNNSFGNLNPMDLMKGMLSPEQQEMFQMYQTMFDQEGAAAHERMDEQSENEEYRSGKTGADPDGGIEDCREIRERDGSDYDGPDHGGQ
jgi:hypothetical protein